MEKTRVKYQEVFYYINESGEVMPRLERLLDFDTHLYNIGNYFHTEEEAVSMVRKLRAVLKGADMIKMPSKEEIKASQDRIEDEVVSNIRDVNGAQLIYCTAINKGAELMADWFESKIVK